MEEKMLLGMRVMRTLSATLEVTAALLLWRMNDAGAMLRLNSLMGAIGPLIFISVSALGLAASVDAVPWRKLVLIFGGIVLVVIGTRS